MKNQNILHYDSENSYFYHLLLALIPLLLYGWYKNGILPFLNQDISWIKMFRPLYFPALVFSVSYLGDMVVAKIKKEKRANSLNPFYGLLLSMTLPINANIFIVSILVFFCFIFFSFWNRTKWKINTLLSTKVILFFILIANVSYFNATENINNLFYSLIDIFLGRNIGGLASTSIILMLGAYAFLSFDYYYKKSIPVYTFLTFTITALIIELITPTGDLLKFILNPSVIFASIFFATEITSSPYTETGSIICGILNGFLACLLTRFYSLIDGVYIAIFLVSLFVPLIDNIAYKKEKKNQKFCRKQKKKKENSLTKKDQNLKFILPKKKSC